MNEEWNGNCATELDRKLFGCIGEWLSGPACLTADGRLFSCSGSSPLDDMVGYVNVSREMKIEMKRVSANSNRASRHWQTLHEPPCRVSQLLRLLIRIPRAWIS